MKFVILGYDGPEGAEGQTMADETFDAIQRGLAETREHLTDWVETRAPGKKQIQCCAHNTSGSTTSRTTRHV